MNENKIDERSIEELKIELAQVTGQISDLKKKEVSLEVLIASKLSKFQLGDTIEYPFGSGRRTGVVARIVKGYNKPSMHVRTILKSGKPGAIATVHWFDHDKCKLVSKGGAA